MPPNTTQMTIWIALACWFTALCMTEGGRQGKDRSFRAFWTLGFLAYLLHVILAFHLHHDWSHAAAVAEVARQTADTTGFDWGGGIWFNYLFTAAWGIDTIRLWIHSAPSLRAQWLTRLWRGFMFSMIFNATVVFEEGAVRWLGLIACLILVSLHWTRSRKSPDAPTATTA